VIFSVPTRENNVFTLLSPHSNTTLLLLLLLLLLMLLLFVVFLGGADIVICSDQQCRTVSVWRTVEDSVGHSIIIFGH
jgi:membrane-anchored glycerophosphoryl diester phosphodiesterase (GDPDase)